jgi:hypothetical protein
LPISIAGWALFHFSVLKKEQRRPGWLYLPLLYGLGICAAVGGAAFQTQQARIVATTMQQASRDAPTGTVIQSAPRVFGPMGELQRALLRLNEENAVQQRDYNKAMETTGLARLLDAKSLADAEAILQSATNVVSRYRSKYFALLDSTRNELETSTIPPDLKSQVLQGFDEGMSQRKPLLEAIWNDEAATVNAIGDAVNFLKQTRGQWRVASGRIAFDTDAEAAQLDQRSEKLQSLARDEANLRQQLAAATQAGADKMTALLGSR